MRSFARRARQITQVWLVLAAINAASVQSSLAQTKADPQRAVRIVAFGDSLTAGYGLASSQAFPVQLEKALIAKGHNVKVINAGVSGDTTGAALERFDWAIPDGVDAAIVELGANDALRGLPPARVRANLAEILKRLQARGIEVLVAGMRAPRNLGDAYVNEFDAIYPKLAQSAGVLHYPFFLDGVALQTSLNLNDGIHPNARGVERIVERMLPVVEQLIARVAAKRAASAKG